MEILPPVDILCGLDRKLPPRVALYLHLLGPGNATALELTI